MNQFNFQDVLTGISDSIVMYVHSVAHDHTSSLILVALLQRHKGFDCKTEVGVTTMLCISRLLHGPSNEKDCLQPVCRTNQYLVYFTLNTQGPANQETDNGHFRLTWIIQ